jgi:pSer/pThr/pTyr-binding forkhead associated (FHA) protein
VYITLFDTTTDAEELELCIEVPAVIGRSRNCEITLQDSSISRQHCELLSHDSGVLVRDLGSTNGIRVDNQQVREALLRHNSLLTVGDTTFQVVSITPDRQDALSTTSSFRTVPDINRLEDELLSRSDPAGPGSLLDSLRHQSADRRAGLEEENRRLESLEGEYGSLVQPCMVKIYSYLKELVEHLQFLSIDVTADYPLLPASKSVTLHQSDYKLYIDNDEDTREMTFKFNCHFPETVKVMVEGEKEIVKYKDYLYQWGVNYQHNGYVDNGMNLYKADFFLQEPLPVILRFEGDIQTTAIIITIFNVSIPGKASYKLLPGDVTPEFLDRLGKFVIRQEQSLFGKPMTDEEKSDIKRRLEEYQRQQEENFSVSDPLSGDIH